MTTRGRPRSNYLPRFNVATDLIENKRFLLFKRKLGVDQQTAWNILTRFFCFVAAHRADSGTIEGEDPETLAEFCWWSGDATMLVSALIESGFIEQDKSVHDWFGNQPWAKKRAEERKIRDSRTENSPDNYRELSERKIPDNGNSHDLSERKLPETAIPDTKKGQSESIKQKSNTHSLSTLEKESISNTAKSSRAPARGGEQVVDNSNGNGRASPDFISRTTEFLEEISELVSLTENDRLGIRFDVIKRGSTEGLQTLLDQLRMAEADGRLGCSPGIVNPVGWIRKRIRGEAHVEPG